MFLNGMPSCGTSQSFKGPASTSCALTLACPRLVAVFSAPFVLHHAIFRVSQTIQQRSSCRESPLSRSNSRFRISQSLGSRSATSRSLSALVIKYVPAVLAHSFHHVSTQNGVSGSSMGAVHYQKRGLPAQAVVKRLGVK